MKLYPWLLPHFKKLIHAFLIGRGHHALLIQAIEGIGDKELVYAIIRFLMCQYPQKYKSCGKCRSCHLMEANTHPDFYELEPQKNKIMLGIDTLRKINEHLYRCSKLGGRKVVRISNIELLTEEAVNSLLKILEEPPNQVLFFLSCHDLKQLPVTLRSRCFLYHLAIPLESYSLSWLNNKIILSEIIILTSLRLCYGAPISTLIFLEKKIFLQRERLFKLLEIAIKNLDWLSLLRILNHNQAAKYLYWIGLLFLDALKIQQGITSTLIINIDSLFLVRKLANYLSKIDLWTIFHDTCFCYKKLLTVIDENCRELILANQLLCIEDYFRKNNK